MNRRKRLAPYNAHRHNNSSRRPGNSFPGDTNSSDMHQLMMTMEQYEEESEHTVIEVKDEVQAQSGPVSEPIPEAQQNMNKIEGSPMENENEARKNTAVMRRDRTNRILHKVKPKSSTAIMHEMYKSVPYVMSTDGQYFTASLTLENETFVGTGRTKSAAQTAAADEALKHMVLSSDMRLPGIGEDPSALTNAHLLSYALYRLLNFWDESGSATMRMQAAGPTRTALSVQPARKFPAEPESMHPVMLLSQTHPMAKYVEVGYSQSPQTTFTIECTVDECKFFGKGQNKKEAKKRAAMQACAAIMGVNYPNMDDV